MYRKEIVWDRETKDFAMYLDNELIGFARTYHEAEVTLDQVVFELLSGANWTDATAREASAEAAAGVHECTMDCPGCANCTTEVHARMAEPAPEPTYVALPSAPSALTDTVSSDPSLIPIARQESAAGATQPAAPAFTAGTVWAPGPPPPPEPPTPPAPAPASGFFLACTICGGPHVPTRCPQVALVKYGMGVWEAYLDDRRAFLKLVQWATAARLKLMGDAVAFYLSHRWGHTITGRQVLIAWMQNAAPA